LEKLVTAEGPFDRGDRHGHPVGPQHGPDLAVAPGGIAVGGLRGPRGEGVDDRRRPAPDRSTVERAGAPVVPGGAGDPEAGREPADREAGLRPDQLELFERG
jgi:hypothetical protein